MNNIAGIFEKYSDNTTTNEVTILDSIMDEITLESASKVLEESLVIINTYGVMAKIDESLSNPESITTESGINSIDNYITEQLTSIGLTKEYFGFTNELTVESATETVNDSKWKKVWEWIKTKIKQIKDWITKIIDSLFNRNKTTLKQIEALKKIKLGKLIKNDIDNNILSDIIPYLKNYTDGINNYITILHTNYKNFGHVTESINISNGYDEVLLLINNSYKNDMSASKHVFSVLNIGSLVEYGVLVDIGDRINVSTIKDNKLSYDHFTITGMAKPSDKTKPLTTNSINANIEDLYKLTKLLDDDHSKEMKIIEKLINSFEQADKKQLNNNELDVLTSLVTLVMRRLTNIKFTNGEIPKLIKCIVLHMKCYETL